MKNKLCLLALAAVLSVLLHEALFLGKGLTPADGIFRLPPWQGMLQRPVSNYMLSDQYVTLAPLRHFIYDTLRDWKMPLWNPYLNCGVPSIGMMQMAPFFPVNFILSIIEPFRAGGLAAFLKLFFAGAFMFLYMRQLGAGTAASLFSGIAFGLSGFMIVWLGHPHTNSAALLPLLLYFIDAGLAGSSRRPWIGLAAAYGCMVLGGHPPTIIHLSALLPVYFIFRSWDRPLSQRAGPALFFTLAVATGVLIAAVQLLPYVEYYRWSSTDEVNRTMQRWLTHLPLSTLTHFVMPLISGSPARRFESLGLALGLTGGPADNFNERTGYVGLLSLFLALVALLYRRDRIVRFYGWFSLACFYVIWGLPWASRIIHALPLLGLITSTRLLLPLGFSLAVLAGLGLDELGRRGAAVKTPLSICLGTATALFFFWLWEAFRPLWPELTAAEKGFLWGQFPVFFGGVLAAGLLLVLPRALARWGKILALAWLSTELVYYGIGYNPALERALYYPKTPALEFLARDPSLFRVLGLGWTLTPNTNILYKIQDARGQDYVTVKRYEELITGAAGQYFFYNTVQELPASLAALGVKYLLAPNDWKPAPGFERVYAGEISIYRSAAPVERARILFDYRVGDAAQTLSLARSPDFDPKRLLLLEQEPAPAQKSAAPGEAVSARVVSYAPNEVILEASAPRPGFLLLLDTYYPGWKAFVNKAPATIYRADYNFRAVQVPAGKSLVRFVYTPLSFYAGLGISLTALLLLVYAWRRTR